MKTSWKDRLVSALATGALVMGMFPVAALAEAASVLDSTATGADPAGPGHDLVVSGLENGDTAKYYKIIEQDADKTQDVYTRATEYDTTANYYTKNEDNYTQVAVANEAEFAASGPLYVKSTSTTIGTQKWKLTTAVDKYKYDYTNNKYTLGQDGIVDGTEQEDFGHKKLQNNNPTPVNGLYVDEMVITTYTTENNAGNVVDSDTRQLTPKMVNAIATAVTNNKPDPLNKLEASDRKVTVTGAESGLYMFVAVPKTGDTDYIYKPVFVAADYYNKISKPEDGTHAIDLTHDATGQTVQNRPYPADYLGNTGVFKRSPLTVDKKSGKLDQDGTTIKDLQSDVAVGDVIDFTITVPIPTYSENYVAPQFFISDTLTEGLSLVVDSIKVEVKNGGEPVNCFKDTDYQVFTKTGKEDEGYNNTDKNYYDFTNTLPKESTFHGFVVQFLNDKPNAGGHHDGFLYTVVGAPTATITYQARVTKTDDQLFAQQVNQMDNTAKLIYSKDPNFIPDGYYTTEQVPDPDHEGQYITRQVPNTNFEPDNPLNKVKVPENPNDPKVPENTGKLTDKTRHYTFDIDADVLGRDQSVDPVPAGTPAGDTESWHDKTSEVRKVWINANGTDINQDKASTAVVKGGTEATGKDGEYGWLEGAEFSLTKIQDHTVKEKGRGTFTPCAPVEMKFDGTTHILKDVTDGGVNPTSDAKGYIAMKGLDAGVYEMKEVRAPLGYAFNPNIMYTITITPNYVLEPLVTPGGTTPEDGKDGNDDLILESYEVKIETKKLDQNLNVIDGETVVTTSTYTVQKIDGTTNPKSILYGEEGNDGTVQNEGKQNPNVTMTTTVLNDTSNTTAMVYNKKLGILPATGGSGILFYLFVGGGIAAIALVLMRKTKKAATAA